MAKRTKALSGQSARRYFRAMFSAERGVPADAADRLADTCVREISDLRVRMPLVQRRLDGLETVASAVDAAIVNVAAPEVAKEPVASPTTDAPSPVATSVDVPAATTTAVQEQPPATDLEASPAPAPTPVPQPAPTATAPAAPAPIAVVAETATPAPAFDPFAFSLIVIMRRAGKAGLLDKLRSVGDTGRLREIARAQHIGLDGIDADSELDDLCQAIVAGTERRIAHRTAAAS